MEKPFIETKEQLHLSQSPSAKIYRKPVPTTVTAPLPALISDDKVGFPPHQSDKQAPSYSTLSNIPASRTSQYNAPLPPLPPRLSLQARLRHRYTTLPKRTRYILLALLLSLLILIIGLAAGVSSHKSHFSNLPLPSSHGGPYTGDLTYYDPGLGACGITSSSSDYIVAVSHLVFDAVSTSSNPNANPLCGKKIRANRNGKSVDLTVVDRCTGCKPQDLDVTETVFAGLASIDQGRVGVTWAWLEDVPGAATGSR